MSTFSAATAGKLAYILYRTLLLIHVLIELSTDSLIFLHMYGGLNKRLSLAQLEELSLRM